MAVVIFVAGSGLGALVASRVGVSPEQAAANANPAPPGPTSAVIERRVLATSMSVRGAVIAPRAVDIVAQKAPDSTSRLVLTRLHLNAGDRVTTPAAVAEISGRPAIVITAELPFYRDMRFGDQGPDVAALQRALVIRETGRFDVATQASLRSLYEGLGYSPPFNTSAASGAEEDREATLAALTDAVGDAQVAGDEEVAAAAAAVAASEAAYANGTGSPEELQATRDAYDAAVRSRDRSVARAERNLERERERLREVALIEGPYFAQAEVVSVPTPALTAVRVPFRPGAALEDGSTVMTLGDSALGVVTYVTNAEAQMLRPGMPASVTGSALTEQLDASVAAVATAPENLDTSATRDAPTGAAPSPERPFRVDLELPTQPPSSAVGAGVLVTITLKKTAEPVLAAPATAVRQQAGEQIVVSLPDRRRWVVETGASAEGWIELRHGAPPVGTTVETR